MSKGARRRVPQLSRRDDWNQPRCWSEPSRYMTRSAPPSRWRLMPASCGKACASSRVKVWVEPESNQTSRMSVTCSQSAGLSTSPVRNRSCAPASNQASAPFSAIALRMRAISSPRLGEARRRHDLARLLVLEHGDGHAPGALARDHPVGPRLDHAAQAVLARGRHELGLGDGLQGQLAQRLVACDAGRSAAAIPSPRLRGEG